MAGPVSLFEHFPIGWAREFVLQKEASQPAELVIKAGEKKEDRLLASMPPKAGIFPSSTEPQFRELAAQQAPVKVGAMQSKIVEDPVCLIDPQTDQAQRFPGTPDKAVSDCHKTPVTLPGREPLELTAPRRTNKVSYSGGDISGAIDAQDKISLNTLLDAHPYAGRGSADNSVGTFLLNCFRAVASWFGSAAFQWQGTQAAKLLNRAAGVGNADIVQILLDRCMDLVKDKVMIEPALRIAVTRGNAQATSLLLREVIREDPGYVKDCDLSTKAAHLGHGAVLGVLLEEGMALPPEKFGPRYDQLIEAYLGLFAASKTSGYFILAAKTVKEALDSNAGRYIPQRADRASGSLAQAVADEFENITGKGKIPEDLLKYLMDQGMYGLLADLVVDAASLAVTSPSWAGQVSDRKKLFANALNQSAGDRIAYINQARVDSGAPDLFDALMSPQLHLLIMYQESGPAQDAAPSTRKKRAIL